MIYPNILNSKIENDELFVCGLNECGQLGLDDNTNRYTPTLNSFFNNKKIIRMTCGDNHCIALIGNKNDSLIWFLLLENGEVYSWGHNYCGQLGHGDTEDRNTPTLISFFKGMKVVDISDHLFF